LAVLLQVVVFEAIAREQEDCLLVRDAAIIDPPKLDLAWQANLAPAAAYALLNQGHEIGPGEGAVFAIRRFKSDPPQIDAQSFAKITTQLPKSWTLGNPIDLRHVPAFYLAGSEPWLHRGIAGYSYKMSGTLTLLRQDDRILAKLVAHAIVLTPHDKTQKVGREFSTECEVREASIAALTPWEGAGGRSRGLFSPSR
jgi:hypothetical protein